MISSRAGFALSRTCETCLFGFHHAFRYRAFAVARSDPALAAWLLELTQHIQPPRDLSPETSAQRYPVSTVQANRPRLGCLFSSEAQFDIVACPLLVAEGLRSKLTPIRTQLWGVPANLGLRVAFQFHVLPVHELLGSGLPYVCRIRPQTILQILTASELQRPDSPDYFGGLGVGWGCCP